MPNINRMGTVYVETGNPDTVNSAALYAAGELGVAYDWVDRAYQVVKLDSGATAAAGVLPAANQLLYWHNRSQYIVTNALNAAQGGLAAARNEVAGILRNAATAGYYIHMLIRGRNIPILQTDGAAGMAIGDWVIGHATTTAQVTHTNIATPPVTKAVGTAASIGTATLVNVDVDLTNIP